MKKEFIAVGHNKEKYDSYDKVTGKATYVADMKLPGMLYAAVKHSTIPHGIIKSMDTSKALALPGVVAVITPDDVPDIPYSSCGHPMPYDTPLDQYILNKHVRYIGDRIAAVAAETQEIAEEAVRLIEVEYEELPFVTDLFEALEDGAPQLHDHAKNNICGEHSFGWGDVDAAFESADYVIEDWIKLPIVTHCQIENHVSICDINHKGRLTFYISNQMTYIMRERLAKILGLKIRDVHTIKKNLGGGFGGKQEPNFEPIAGLLAMKTKRPVMLEISKEECLAATTTRHGGAYWMKTGVMKDGTIVAREQKCYHNTGAYSSHGHNVLGNTSGQFSQMYPSPNARWYGVSVYTNIVIAGAMRSYGITQQVFATECHTENICRRIGMSPMEFRLKNCRRAEDGEIGGNLGSTNGLRELIEWGRKEIGYDEFMKQPKQTGTKRRGIGFAVGSYGQTCYPHSVELSAARITVHEDASATLTVGCVEIGQGSNTAMMQVAAEATGIPFERWQINEGDSDIGVWDSGAYASRQTYVAATAVKKAGEEIKRLLLTHIAEKKLNCDPKILDCYNGDIYNVETGEVVMDMEDACYDYYYGSLTGGTHLEACASHNPIQQGLTFMCAFAEVEVDMETGYVDLKKFYTAGDAGKLINPLAAHSQLAGGGIMGLGYALTEQLLIDPKSGKVHNDNMLDYKVFTFADVPDLRTYFYETHEPETAYGNKSLGEPPLLCCGPAVRNAVLNAIDVEINECPLTPERVYLAIQAAKAKEAE